MGYNIYMYPFRHVGVAGTFDRLHTGHKKLLNRAFKEGERVSIGLSTEQIYGSKILSQTVETLQYRRGELEAFLSETACLSRASFFTLDDMYGIARWDKTLQALIATPHTQGGAEEVNRMRQSKNLPLLTILIEPLVKGQGGDVISSEAIRMGYMDRQGSLYTDLFEGSGQLRLPKDMRETLRKPLGKVVGMSDKEPSEGVKDVISLLEKAKPAFTVAVGDVVSSSLVAEGWTPDLQIIDHMSRRVPFVGHAPHALDVHKTKNQAGVIDKRAVTALKSAYEVMISGEKKQIIEVKGEEDLLAIPAILLAPLDTVVLYGHYALGVIIVHVSEVKKKEMGEIVAKFSASI